MHKISFLDILRSSGTIRIKTIKLIDFMLGGLICSLMRGREEKEFSEGKLERLLIIRPGGIGDAVFLLPFIKGIKAENPELKIDVLCEKRNGQVFLSQSRLINQIFYYDQLHSLRSIFDHSYDAVVDTEQWHLLSALVAYYVKAGHKAGFATRRLRAKCFDKKVIFEENAYEFENFARLFQPFITEVGAIKNINGCFDVPGGLIAWAKKEVPGKSVSLFLGASIPERRFTRKQSSDIIDFLIRKDFSVAILGGRDVKKVCEDLIKEINNLKVINFAGKASLLESAALIKQSDLFIGPDSGLMHLACAVGTPVVAIFGPGNLKKWRPRGEEHIVICENISCSPCTYFGYTVPGCHKRYPCMRELKTDDIKQALQKRMDI